MTEAVGAAAEAPAAVVESAKRLDDFLRSFPTLWFDAIIKIRIGPTSGSKSCYQNKLLKRMVCVVRGFLMWGKKCVQS